MLFGGKNGSRMVGRLGRSGKDRRFRGLIRPAGLRWSILGGGGGGNSKRRRAAGFALLSGRLLNQLLTACQRTRRNLIPGHCGVQRQPVDSFGPSCHPGVNITFSGSRTPASHAVSTFPGLRIRSPRRRFVRCPSALVSAHELNASTLDRPLPGKTCSTGDQRLLRSGS